MIPWSTEPKNGGLAVHTIVLFSGSCEAGKAAARALHVKLLGDVRPLFYVPARAARGPTRQVAVRRRLHGHRFAPLPVEALLLGSAPQACQAGVDTAPVGTCQGMGG